MGRGILLWLLGVPIPVIILLWLFFGRRAKTRIGPTWDCGLRGLTPKMEYTATGFSKPIRMIFKALFRPRLGEVRRAEPRRERHPAGRVAGSMPGRCWPTGRPRAAGCGACGGLSWGERSRVVRGCSLAAALMMLLAGRAHAQSSLSGAVFHITRAIAPEKQPWAEG